MRKSASLSLCDGILPKNLPKPNPKRLDGEIKTVALIAIVFVYLKQKIKKMPYRYRDYRKRCSPKTGTVMANSNLPYHTWLLAIYIAATGLKGTASTELGSDLGCTQKTAWHLGQRIRKACERDTGNLAATAEVDESYIGGKEENKHADKKLRGGSGTVGKTAVVGMKDRETNQVNAKVQQFSF